MGRMLVAYAWIALLFVVGPTLADRLDDRGLPGGGIVLALIVLSACFVGYAVYTSQPRQRRARAIARLASSVGAPFQRRFWTPPTMHGLPFLALIPVDNREILSGFEGRVDDRRIAVFLRSQAPDDYEPTIWRSCAVTPVAFEAPFLRIERRGVGVGLDGSRLEELSFESETFNDSWRVRTSEREFAEAFVDQRMMAWLEDRATDVAFEVGGGWAMVETDDDADRALLDALEGFVERIPRVVGSLYPPTPEA
jgi:hypothetical protein